MAKIKEESSDEEVLMGGENETQKQNKKARSVELGLDELTNVGSQKNYIDMSQGQSAILTIHKVNKVKSDEQYALSNSEDEDGDPYKIEIVDTDGDVLSVNVWQLWGKIKQAYREAVENNLLNSPKGLELKISHPDRGKYEVQWKAGDSNWRKIQDK